MATHQFFHEITIAREPEVVFDYVTDPKRWHEWFSLSTPPTVETDGQTPGDRFTVRTVRRGPQFLPFSLVRSVCCTITKSDRPYLWELEAQSVILDAVTSYTLSHSEEGTVFKRQFSYTTKGWLRYVEPVLLRKAIAVQSRRSLERLRDKLQSESA
ncbi:SRPBCC family protein [Gilvimarinus sp. F26214L]|uniref:SRPBCC family protein n=1 Tax=Gilvimarinus sp. DZF01 TaxID=3461371 RepID=UPI0040452962